jgi:hypothetical protein
VKKTRGWILTYPRLSGEELHDFGRDFPIAPRHKTTRGHVPASGEKAGGRARSSHSKSGRPAVDKTVPC